MSPATSETKSMPIKNDFEAQLGDPWWPISNPSALADPRRITTCLPPSKGWSGDDAREMVKGRAERGLVRGSGGPVSPVMQLSPRQQAESTHALILAVQREAESRRIREVTRLRSMIVSLKGEIATLKRGSSTTDFGDTVSVHGIDVPAQLPKVIEAIDDSRALLDRGDNWDDNGALGFAEHTWERAATFLVNTTISLAHKHGVIAEEIEILPGSNGGFDIEIRPGDRQLLIVVPADPKKEVRFYGDDGRGGRQIKGTAEKLAAPDWLLTWMAE